MDATPIAPSRSGSCHERGHIASARDRWTHSEVDVSDAEAEAARSLGFYGIAETRPPSTCTFTPLTYDAAGESRNVATRASSAGSP